MFSGIEFQIWDPEYEREFLNCSMLVLGTYKRFSLVDFNVLICISNEC